MKLRALRTACSLPHFSKSVRVSLDARSRPGADSCLFVGIIAMNVNGTTKPISRAPTNHRTPPPSNQAATPARKLKMASEACMTVARLELTVEPGTTQFLRYDYGFVRVVIGPGYGRVDGVHSLSLVPQEQAEAFQ